MHWKRSEAIKDSLENPLKFTIILSCRSSQEYTDLGLSMEYLARASPSAAMMKDMASTVSFPPTEATAASKLIMNYQGSVCPLNFGRDMGL